jgi:GNAT superfamily N-acetyltransferase
MEIPSQHPDVAELSDAPYRVDVLTEYLPQVAAGIGRLMPQLDPGFSGEPVPEDKLVPIIASHGRDQLVAFSADGSVLAAATMNTITGDFNEGWLEDFIVDSAARGTGVAADMYQAMRQWCKQQGLSQFSYGTETHRPAAIKFYERQGAFSDPDIKHATYVLPEAPASTESADYELWVQEPAFGDADVRRITVSDRRDQSIVGSVTLNTLRGAGKQPEAWFDDMAIDAGHSVESVGGLLLASAANWSRSRGLSQISFAINERSAPVLYEYLEEQGAVTDEEALHYTQRVVA